MLAPPVRPAGHTRDPISIYICEHNLPGAYILRFGPNPHRNICCADQGTRCQCIPKAPHNGPVCTQNCDAMSRSVNRAHIRCGDIQTHIAPPVLRIKGNCDTDRSQSGLLNTLPQSERHELTYIYCLLPDSSAQNLILWGYWGSVLRTLCNKQGIASCNCTFHGVEWLLYVSLIRCTLSFCRCLLPCNKIFASARGSARNPR